MTVYGGNISVGNITFGSGNNFRIVSPPTSALGKPGDLVGDIAYDSNYFYTCLNTFTSTQIIGGNIGTAYLGGNPDSLTMTVPYSVTSAIANAANVYVQNSSGTVIGYMNYYSTGNNGFGVYNVTFSEGLSHFESNVGATFWYVAGGATSWAKTPWNATIYGNKIGRAHV